MSSTLGSYRLVKELAPIYKDPYKDPLMTCPVQAGEERFCLALLRPGSISHSLRNTWPKLGHPEESASPARVWKPGHKKHR